MDLIYTDGNKVDQGAMSAYTLDMAYGYDENDFECTVDATDHCCEEGSLIYAEGEEYGGIVDTIGVDTEEETVTYKGRTWHGILQGKVISPAKGQDYKTVTGEANSVLADLITELGLQDMFAAAEDDSGITIQAYRFPRYVYAYEGVRAMLRESDAKLHLEWKGQKVELSALPVLDYSQDEEYDPSQVLFSLEKHYRPTNRIICMGQGNLKDRAVISVFTDENGGIQPYATTDTPVMDSDYITDSRNQIMKGEDEVAEILDYSSAEIVTNYVLMTSKPSDWDTRYASYFEQEKSEYKAVEPDIIEYELTRSKPSNWDAKYNTYYTRSGNNYTAVPATTVYELTTRKPSDWTAKFNEYYTKNGNSYSAVKEVVTTSYTRQTSEPADWSRKYAEYYVYFSDGVTSEYRAVSGIQYDTYKVQTVKPTDWAENYGSYYRKATAKEQKETGEKWKAVEPWIRKTTINGKSREVEVTPLWEPSTYYTQYSRTRAPKWADAARYTQKKKAGPPAWETNKYYDKDTEAAPTWEKKKYYAKVDEKVAPKWVSGQYYRAVQDRYASLVENAIKRLQEAHESDPMQISLGEDAQTRDVGDIVGTLEPTTGIKATQEIVKKIIKIENDDLKITYEVK